MVRASQAWMAVLIWAAPVWAGGGAGDLLSDTWVGSDALGRALPGAGVCGPPRTGRYVGIFYFLWHGQHGTSGPHDITKLLAANPANPAWGPVHAFHHWGEPELGYYLADDAWVLRRHCHLLVDAGVDAVFLDVTNAFTYTANYQLLCSVYRQIRAEGGRTPQIAFVANASSALVVQKLYDDFYAKNLYPELWFRWQGKPLMLASPDGVAEPARGYFTFRQSWAWSHPSGWFGNGQDKWPWLDHSPQAFGWHVPDVPEEIPVAVAQHPTTNIGRSYRGGRQPAPADQQPGHGIYFAEQAERALAVDPEILFITGWNEWVAQRFVSDGNADFLGRKLPAGESYFVDDYTQEYSRDIEPMKGGHTDNYYYQMASLIRRFKGVRTVESPSPPTTVAIDGQFNEWESIRPDYWDTVQDTVPRHHPGWGSAGVYTDNSGRNDFTRLKVAYDADHVYFYAQTRSDITSPSGADWMLLYIDADRDRNTGWQGYDYLVNSTVSAPTMSTLKRCTGGYHWAHVSDVALRVSGPRLELAVPRAGLGMANSDHLWFEFHWADHPQQPADLISMCTTGDSAPNRRANYRFSTLAGPPGPVSQLDAEKGDSVITLRWIQPDTPDFLKSVVRYSTVSPPTDPTDGIALAEVVGTPGSAAAVVHANVPVGVNIHYSVFTCDLDGFFDAGTQLQSRLASSDFDGDGDMDQFDCIHLAGCMTGEYLLVSDQQCQNADLDGDGDADQSDFGLGQRCLSGSARPMPAGCLQ